MNKEAFPDRTFPELTRRKVQEPPMYPRLRRTSKIIADDRNFHKKNEITGKTNIISEEGSEKGGEAGSVPRTYSMGAQPPSLNQPFDGKTNNSILFPEYEKFEDEYFAHLSAETDNEQEFYIAKFSRDYEKILEEHRKNKARCPEICQSDELKDTTKEHTEYSSSSEDGNTDEKSKIRGKPRKKILRKRKINIIHNKMAKFITDIQTSRDETTRMIVVQADRDPLSIHIRNLISLKKSERKKWQHTGNATHRDNFRSVANIVRREIKRFNDDVWQRKLERLDVRDNSLWNMSKRVKKKYEPMPTIESGSTRAMSNSEKVELFAEYFHNVHATLPDVSDPQRMDTIIANEISKIDCIKINPRT
ncbi:hypothetical protein JTB14_014918 [Gonioctena quinquepunctata]|nr:hypothetical protein JTB14_014918 [Gonioctena quinquepunctata]